MMIDLRCKHCNKLLAKVETINGAIKCPSCHMLFEYKVFSNLFVTNEYDPNKHLRIEKDNDNINTESNETKPD